MMRYEISFAEDAVEELEKIKAFQSNKIVNAIEKQLIHQPTRTSKNRKCLSIVPANFHFEPPLWELRVGEYRVFYDVDEEAARVHIRAVRRKRPVQRTEDIVQ